MPTLPNDDAPKRRHYRGDGCDPAHILTILAPENPDDVRDRDKAHIDRDLPNYRRAHPTEEERRLGVPGQPKKAKWRTDG